MARCGSPRGTRSFARCSRRKRHRRHGATWRRRSSRTVLLVCKPRPERSLGRKLARPPGDRGHSTTPSSKSAGTTRLRSRVALVARYGLPPLPIRLGEAGREPNERHHLEPDPAVAVRREVVPHVREAVSVPTAHDRDSGRVQGRLHRYASSLQGRRGVTRSGGTRDRAGGSTASPRRLRVSSSVGGMGRRHVLGSGADSSTPATRCDRVPPGPVG